MSKLTINDNKGISFVSLGENGEILLSNLNNSNGFKMNGNLNVSFNSKNSIDKNENTKSSFEFSNNDNIDLVNGKIDKKSINDSRDIISILCKGVYLNHNDSVISINSYNDKIGDSEIVAITNTNNSTINNTKEFYVFGSNNEISKSNQGIVIGHNISTYGTKNPVVIGKNVNTNTNNQVLIGDFTQFNVGDISIAISNKNNHIYTTKSGENIKISDNLIFNGGVYIDGLSYINNYRNVVLNKDVSLNVSNHDNIILNKSINEQVSNDVIIGEDNTSKFNSGNIILGNNNNISEVSKSYILGEDNSNNGTSYNILNGYKNEIKSCSYSIIAGYGNNFKHGSYDIILGSNNYVGSGNKFIVAGENHNFTYLNDSIVIGENFGFNLVKYLSSNSHSYVISNGTNCLLLDKEHIFIDKNEPVKYDKYLSGIKNFSDYYSKFLYSLISNAKTTLYKTNNEDKYIKMSKNEGFCNICTSPSSVSLYRGFYTLYFKDDKLKVNMRGDDTGYYIQYKTDDDYVYIKFYSSKVIIEESSKCEIIDAEEWNNVSSYEYGPERIGNNYTNLDTKDGIIKTSTLRTSNYTITKPSNLGLVEAKTLYTQNYTINNITFENILSKVPKNIQLIMYAKESKEFLYKYDYDKALSSMDAYTILGLNVISSFKGVFYCNDFNSTKGGYIVRNEDEKLNRPIVLFKSNKKTYDYFNIQRKNYTSLAFKNDGEQSLLTSNSRKDIKTYLENSNRCNDKSSNARILDSDYTEQNYDTLIRLKDENGSDISSPTYIDFISNYNSTYFVKWGIFANISFDALQSVSDTADTSDTSYSTQLKQMWITGKTTDDNHKRFTFVTIPNGDKISINNAETYSSVSRDVFKSYFGNDISNVFTYKQVYGSVNYQNIPFYIPFASSSSMITENVYLYKGIDDKWNIINNLRPKSKNFGIIKRINTFSKPIDLLIRYNYGAAFRYFDELGDAPISSPFFYGTLNTIDKNPRDDFYVIYDYDYGTYNERSANDMKLKTRNYIDVNDGYSMNNTKKFDEDCKDFKYLDVLPKYSSDEAKYFLRPKVKHEVSPRVTVTYILNSL